MKKTVFSISEFKARSLGLLERVSKTGESLVVTKHGKPIAKVIPFTDQKDKPVPGKLADTLLDEQDIVSPFGARLWKAAEPGDDVE
jgi:prevent-host-death family protein